MLANNSSMLADRVREILYRNSDENERRNAVPRMLDFLCEKGVLRVGLEFQCSRCKRWGWYHISCFDENYRCQWCFTEQKTPRLDGRPWRYKSDGPFLLKNKMEGCFTVLLALHFFQVYFGFGVNYVASFNYADGTQSAEADFAVFVAEFLRDDVEIILGEAKTGRQLDEDEKRRIKKAAVKMNAIAAFCTQAESFAESDRSFFKELVASGQRVILLPGPRLAMSYEGVLDYKHKGRAMTTDADLLSRISTIDVLGEEFAHQNNIWLW